MSIYIATACTDVSRSKERKKEANKRCPSDIIPAGCNSFILVAYSWSGTSKYLNHKAMFRETSDLTLSMLRLLSSKSQRRKDFEKPSKPCPVGIHWIAIAEYSQMSTHKPGFQSFFRFFCIIWYWPNKPPAAKGLKLLFLNVLAIPRTVFKTLFHLMTSVQIFTNFVWISGENGTSNEPIKTFGCHVLHISKG